MGLVNSGLKKYNYYMEKNLGYIWRMENMEKMRRIFPVLFALVLVLGIMIVPASADCPVVDGTCPCCGSSNITLDVVTTPEDDVITDFKCYSCCYDFIYFLGTDSYNEAGICTWEWCIDKENGNHYQYCSKCKNKKNEGPHFLQNCTRIEGTDTHQGTCTVCGAEVIVDCSGGTATCVAKAVCEFCGQEYGETDANNHNPDINNWTIDPNKGIHYHKCLNDGCTKQFALATHNVESWAPVEGTNTHQGTCTECGAAVTEPHSVSGWTPVDETNTHQGTCTKCGVKVTGEHNFSFSAHNAEGEWHLCSFCWAVDGAPSEHHWGDWCNAQDGTHYRRCTTCDELSVPVPHQYELTYVDEEYHMWICACGAEQPETEAEPHNYVLTDVGEGYHMWKCACGAVKPETDAEPHEYGNWTRIEGTNTHKGVCDCGAEDIADCSGGTPTCTAGAICDICGLEYGEPDPANHDLAHHDAKPATCTEIGWDAYDTCKREGCGYTTYKEIAALGHDLEHRDAQAATCTDFGWEAYDRCTREGCDYSTYKEIPALGHDIEHHDAKAATCTEDGWPAYDTCKREGCNYTTLLIMQARLGHILTHHKGKAATCTEAGWEAYDTCKREGCDYSTYQEIPALGHDLVKHDAKAATCTEAGWEAYDTCSRCSYTTYQEIPVLDHIPGEPVVTARKEPQVGKAGYEETRICCTVCGLELKYSYHELHALPEPEPVPDTKEETPGKPDAEIAILPRKTVLRIIPPESLDEKLGLELSVNQQIVSDDGGVDFQTGSPSFYLDIPPRALKLIEAKAWRLEKFYSDLADRVILDYTGSQEFPLNLDLVMILVYRDDDAQEHWEVLKKTTRLFGNRLRAEVDAALVRKLQSRPFAIIILADDGTR